jgi:hypothetical protein
MVRAGSIHVEQLLMNTGFVQQLKADVMVIGRVSRNKASFNLRTYTKQCATRFKMRHKITHRRLMTPSCERVHVRENDANMTQ